MKHHRNTLAIGMCLSLALFASAGAQQADKNSITRPLTAEEIRKLRQDQIEKSKSTILSPADVNTIRKKVLDSQEAINGYGGQSDEPPPAPQPKVLQVSGQSLANDKPPTVNLALGLVTPVTFIDAKGRPWPIAEVVYDNRVVAKDGDGCGQASENKQPSDGFERPTTIHLMPCRFHSFGNVAIVLENYALPVVLMFKSGKTDGIVDIPVTVKIRDGTPASLTPALAPPPAATAAAGRTRKPNSPTVEQRLHAFASGRPPRTANRMTVSGATDISAWVYEGRLYLKGPITVVNPAHDAGATGPGGTRVWRLPRPASRILVMRDDGSETAISVDF